MSLSFKKRKKIHVSEYFNRSEKKNTVAKKKETN